MRWKSFIDISYLFLEIFEQVFNICKLRRFKLSYSLKKSKKLRLKFSLVKRRLFPNDLHRNTLYVQQSALFSSPYFGNSNFKHFLLTWYLQRSVPHFVKMTSTEPVYLAIYVPTNIHIDASQYMLFGGEEINILFTKQVPNCKSRLYSFSLDGEYCTFQDTYECI